MCEAVKKLSNILMSVKAAETIIVPKLRSRTQCVMWPSIVRPLQLVSPSWNDELAELYSRAKT